MQLSIFLAMLEFMMVATLSKSMKLRATAYAGWSAWGTVISIRKDLGLSLIISGVGAIGNHYIVFFSILPTITFHILSLLVVAEFYYFYRTGSHGDAYLLRLVFAHASDIFVLARRRTHVVLARILAYLSIPQIPLFLNCYIIIRGENDYFSWKVVTILSIIGIVLTNIRASEIAGRYLELSVPFAATIFRDFFRTAPWQRHDEHSVVTTMCRSAILREAPRLPRNIVLVVFESARDFSHLPPGTLPFLGRLANDSVAIEYLYAVVPHTTKALIPILAGRYPTARDKNSSIESLASIASSQGYRTAFFTPADVSFEGKGDLLRRMGFTHIFGAEDIDPTARTRVQYLGHDDAAAIEPAIAWARDNAARGARFFLNFLTLSSHHPYTHPGGHGMRGRPGEFQRYLEALTYTDRCIERLFEGLRRAGLLHDCLFVVVGDHGQAFSEHGRRYHSASLWEEALRVPCVIWDPEAPRGSAVAGVRSQLDLTPTILELAGLPPLVRTSGASLLLPEPQDRELFHATWIDNQSLSLRNGNMKFLYHFGRERSEYFDIFTDPCERRNLIDGLSCSEQGALVDRCLSWRSAIMPN